MKPRRVSRALDASASASPEQHQRPGYLRASHALNVREATVRTRAPTPESDNSRGLDSANFKAARDLRLARIEAGLSQEELAARTGEDVKTIGQRERGKFDLGALRQLVFCERAKKERGVK